MSVPQMPAAATFSGSRPDRARASAFRAARSRFDAFDLAEREHRAGLYVKDVHGPDQLVVDHDDLFGGDSEAAASRAACIRKTPPRERAALPDECTIQLARARPRRFRRR